MIKVNGKSFYAGPEDAVTMKTGQDGRCRISIPTNTLFTPVLHIHADFMDAADEFVTLSPNADLQLKLKNLDRDGGLAAAKKNPLGSNPEPLFASDKVSNLDQVGQYLSESMKLLPAIDYAADLRYLRLNREIPDQPNPKTAATGKPKKFGRLAPPPNMRFGLKIENGRATFLQGDENWSPDAMAKSASEWFEGAWGDVWHFVKQAGTAIQDGFSIVVDTLVDGIRATLNFVINGVTYAYKGVANLVQEVFGMVEGVFSAIGAAFEDLVAWLGYLFDWDDILRTQRALEAVTNRSLTHLKEGLQALEQYLVQQLHDARGSMDAAFVELSKQVVHQDATLAKANEQQPGATTSDSVMSQNIVFNGMLDNAHTAPAPQAPKGENIFAKIIDDLSAELSHFADSPELRNLAATLNSASYTPQNFVDVALPAIFRAIQTMLDIAFDIAETLLQAMLEKLIDIVRDILDILNMSWDIPLVSELYAKISGGQRLSFLNLSCLIVAVPTTPLYKIAVGNAPFADEGEFNEFMDAFGFDSPQKAKRTALAAAKKDVSQATLDKWQPVMRSLLLIGQGVTTFLAILPDSVLAAAPPPPVKIPDGEAAPLVPKPDPLDDYRKSLGNTNYLTPLSWISTILSALNHAAGIPINLLNPNVSITNKFSPKTSNGRANIYWAAKWIKIGSNTYSLWTSGYKLQETSAWGAIADMLMALGGIGLNIYKEVKRDERQWLDFWAKTLLEVPNVFAFLKTKYFTTISPPGTSLLIYAGMQGACKTVSFGLTFARWALLLNGKTDDLPEDQMNAG